MQGLYPKRFGILPLSYLVRRSCENKVVNNQEREPSTIQKRSYSLRKAIINHRLIAINNYEKAITPGPIAINDHEKAINDHVKTIGHNLISIDYHEEPINLHVKSYLAHFRLPKSYKKPSTK